MITSHGNWPEEERPRPRSATPPLAWLAVITLHEDEVGFHCSNRTTNRAGERLLSAPVDLASLRILSSGQSQTVNGPLSCNGAYLVRGLVHCPLTRSDRVKDMLSTCASAAFCLITLIHLWFDLALDLEAASFPFPSHDFSRGRSRPCPRLRSS